MRTVLTIRGNKHEQNILLSGNIYHCNNEYVTIRTSKEHRC